eukprot:11307965-Alexandrium_andersonii.AAC.1
MRWPFTSSDHTTGGDLQAEPQCQSASKQTRLSALMSLGLGSNSAQPGATAAPHSVESNKALPSMPT